nr:hypothetical protein 49 [Balneolaceae bacterium]
MTFSSFKAYETPKDRLLNCAKDAVLKSRRSDEIALQKFIGRIIDDADLLVALIGRDRLDQIALQFLRDNVSAGNVPATKTGSNAVADEKGHRHADVRPPVASSSVPHSKTPAQPVGGGRDDRDTSMIPASPSSKTWSQDDVKVTEHTRRKPNAPRVSPQDRLKHMNRHAMSILDTVKVRGLAIGDWEVGKAMQQAKESAWEGRLLAALTAAIPAYAPENDKLRTYLTPDQVEKILKEQGISHAA